MPAPTRTSLAAWLAAARAAITAPASQRPRPLYFVVGNESADLDSLCSAVLLAYFRSHARPHSALHVPLANLPRADLRLRPELQAVFRPSSSAQGLSSDLSPSDLITLSELPDDLKAADTRWLLVDHNALTGDLARRFAKSVVGCIDHHADEGVVVSGPQGPGWPEPRIITPCGSCASLVVEHYSSEWEEMAGAQSSGDDSDDRHLVARLALAPILVDTGNLTSASKTTDVDRRAADLATSALPASFDRAAFFDELSRLKDDLSNLDYGEMLRKDYKQWTEERGGASSESGGPSSLTLGMATVVQGIPYLLANKGGPEALLQGLRDWAAERQLDVAAVMTVQREGSGPGFARQLLLWAFSEAGVVAARQFVARHADRLGLVPWDHGRLDDTATPGQWRACWEQQRTEFSRKQVAPFLREAMR